ncbi:hypothetical protein PTSG_10115 [Salpingoeca rosetta]|uniref:Guanylate cyclase domain-containing protein n=1 Tax=Salpingoeca rosetta (strain ATCC 50818 / BSB-021) TaxID=946362 RepID=F2UPJ2_SALR5|nr:uncharacterized protein PTSG_10115 [Salpingoeca rosetta]EGD79547.1 hypothetical protein PTSG_10115 [Salpingoeca rosetta]|eukprot:XP_004989028.1 hypothetical protein PTSG_10115 [Salpingoeca rosetta]
MAMMMLLGRDELSMIPRSAPSSSSVCESAVSTDAESVGFTTRNRGGDNGGDNGGDGARDDAKQNHPTTATTGNHNENTHTHTNTDTNTHTSSSGRAHGNDASTAASASRVLRLLKTSSGVEAPAATDSLPVLGVNGHTRPNSRDGDEDDDGGDGDGFDDGTGVDARDRRRTWSRHPTAQKHRSEEPKPAQGWASRRAASDPQMLERSPKKKLKRKKTGWDRVKSLRSLSSCLGVLIFKDNPVISFVSRQLHKYLLNVEDEIEEATGTTKLGAVLFADASGFTAMTQRLAKKPNGAEELSRIINNFFSRLLKVVDAFGGDVVKFSGDALSIVWFVDEEESARTEGYVAPSLAVATMRACACAHELHQKLDQYLAIKATATEPGVRLRLHMGIGAGRLTSVHVGGIFKRWEYILAGPPMTQIAIAEPLAKPGETVISPEAAEIAGKIIQGKTTIGALADRGEREPPKDPAHRAFIRIDAVRHIDIPKDYSYRLPVNEQVNRLMRRYIPKAVLQCLDENQPPQSEMRNVSVIFVNIHGLKLEVPAPSGDATAPSHDHLVSKVIKNSQTLMLEIQRNVYTWEGSINKLMVDDKGLLVLCAMGLPPMPHFDDPVRAVEAAVDLRDNIALLSEKVGVPIHATIGVSTGRAFCGVVGSKLRREYTLMGDVVNLAARLMCTTQESAVVVDPVTHRRCEEILPDRFDFKPIEELRLKGMEQPITAYFADRSHKASARTEAVVSDISGRENERERLGDMVHRLIELKGGTLVLTGTRGSGKSQLVKALQSQGKERKVSVLHVTKGQRSAGNIFKRPAPDDVFDVTKDLPVVVFGAWHPVFTTLLEMAGDTVIQRIEWAAATVKKKRLGQYLVLLRHVLPKEYAQPLLVRHADTEATQQQQLTFKESIDAILEMMYLCFVRFAKTTPTMIILHLQTGTALKVHVDPESWQLAMKLSEHCLRRRHESPHGPPLVLCIVTRPLTKIEDPMIKSIWRNASLDDTFMELKPLSEMARLRYAAQVLSQLSNKTVSQAALPPELVIFLDERAAGIPKHISETLRECMKSDALVTGPAIRITDNGRIECDDLHDVRVPDKIVAIVNQEFVQLSPSHQALLKAVCVHRSFTEAMARTMVELSRRRDLSFEYKGNLHDDLNELVKLHVLKRVPANVYTTSYFPPDLFSQNLHCFAFSSKVMQQEVSRLMMEHMHGHLRNEVSQRISTVVGAVVKIQALFRRIVRRRKTRECGKRAFHAALVIQKAFRDYLMRVRERRRRESTTLQPPRSEPASRRASYGILRSSSEDEPPSPERTFDEAPAHDFVTFIPTENTETSCSESRFESCKSCGDDGKGMHGTKKWEKAARVVVR